MVTELFGGADPNVSDPLLDRLRLATLGTYDVAGELGRGGMAIVYVGKDLRLGRTVAIKVMDPRLSLAQGMAERFLQEARIAANLQHPNIIVVHEIKQSEDLIFFVMGLIEGGALDELCRDSKSLPIEQVRWILLQATRALAHAHSDGIIHRDVKPANILINLKGDVILTDFGIAKAVGGNGMTQSGTQIGTPTYMSPEQFGDQPVGPASDQYALGVTAYQLLTGKLPFTGDLFQLIAAHGSKVPLHVRELRPDCPAFLANAVMRMLEKRPGDRWPALDDLQGVFGANMAMDGGAARKQLAVAAQTLQRQRARTIAPLSAKTPVSPIPVGGSRLRQEAAPQPELLVVSISPPGATIYVGGTLELKASVASETGEPVPPGTIIWTTSNAAVLIVRSNGSLSGVSAGSALVRATVHDAWEEATIRVEPAPIARITVTDPRLTLKVGDLAHPAVSAIDVNGQSRTDISFSWISRTPSVAVLDSPGTIRGLTPGDATVEVSVGNVRRLIEVTVVRRPIVSLRIRPVTRVLELGDAFALFTDAFDDLGKPAATTSVRWTSTVPHVIHVDSAGTALAIGPGVAQIIAEIDDATDSIELNAVEAPIGAIDVKLAARQVEVGAEVPLILEVRDQSGAFRSTSGVRVWSSAPAIAEIDIAAMVVRAVAVGEVRIHAAAETSDSALEAVSAQLTVSAAAITRIQLSPTAVDLEMGAVASMSARYFDRAGRAVTNVFGTWQSGAPDVAAVEGNGVVRGLSAGTTEIRHYAANADGKMAEASIPVRVRRATIARLVIAPSRKSLAVGEAIDLVASAWDTTGLQAHDLVPVWTSSDTRIASVSARGQVTALAPGPVVVSAELDGRRERVAIQVVPAALISLTVSLSATQGIVGVPLRATATAKDATGSVTRQLRWTVEPPDRAQISAEGELVPLQPGMMIVTASIILLPEESVGTLPGVREGSAALEVREPRVESIKLDHDAITLRLGHRRRIVAQFAVEGQSRLQRGAVTWSSNNPAIVRVLESGEVEAIAIGESHLVATAGDARANLVVSVRASRFASVNRRALVVAAAGVATVVLAWIVWPTKSAVLTGPSTRPTTDSARAAVDEQQSARALLAENARKNDSVKRATTDSIARALAGDGRGSRNDSAKKADSVRQQARNTADGLAKASLLASAGKARADSSQRTQARAADSIAASRVAEQRAVAQRTALDSAARADSARRATAARDGRGQPTASEAPSIDDVPTQVARIVDGMRDGSQGNAEIKKLLSDRRPTVDLVPSSVVIVSQEAGRIHAKFEVRVSSYNGVGIPKTRIAPVTFELAGRRGATEVRNVQFGPLAKTP